MDLIDHAAAVLRMFDIEPKPLDRLLEGYLSRHREIGSRNRRAIAHAVFGVMRWLRRIDGLLKQGGIAKPDHRMRVRAFLRSEPQEGISIDTTNDGIELPAGSFMVNAPMPRRFPGGAAAFYSFPDFLYERLIDQYGADGAALMAQALNSPSLPCLRVNTMRSTRDEAIDALKGAGVDASATAHSPFGIRLSRRVSLGSLDVYSRGIVEVQDESSQLAVLAADPRAGESVMDPCAGAGGKSLMIAMLMEGRGSLIASDIDSAKLRELERRSVRAGAQNIAILEAADLRKRELSLRGSFDLVFVDAPCTGTGTLRRNPDLKWRLREEEIGRRVSEQRALLDRHADLVRSGGRLVYATCSILREENEDVVAHFLRRKEFRMMDVRTILARSSISSDRIETRNKGIFIDPREGEWDGFFAAAMERK